MGLKILEIKFFFFFLVIIKALLIKLQVDIPIK